MINRLRRLAPIAFGLIVLVVIINIVAQSYIGQQQRDIDNADAQAQVDTATIGAAMNNQETGLRGYIISANESFLDPFTQGRSDYERVLADLRSLFADPSFTSSRANLAMVQQSAEDWYVSYALVQQQRVSSGQQATAQQAEVAGAGKSRFDTFRLALNNLQNGLTKDIADRQSQNDAGRTLVQVISALLTLGFVFILGLLIYPFINDTRTALIQFTEATARITEGDFKIRLPEEGDDEFSKLGHNFNRMAQSLRQQNTSLREKDIQAAVLEISTVLNASLELDPLLNDFLEKLLEMLTIQVGAIYLVDPNHPQHLRLAASQGFDYTQLTNFIKVGEGDVGRAIKYKKSIITDLAAGTQTEERAPETAEGSAVTAEAQYSITTAFGVAVPRVVGHWPLQTGDQPLGVLVLASLTALPTASKNILNVVLPQVATAISNAQAYTHINEQKLELERRGAELEAINRQVAQQRDELRVINAALEESNRLRSQFLSTMSHELRTPLTAIIGFSQLSLRGATGAQLPERVRGNIERILKNGQNLLTLVNDVLDLAKIEAGRMDVSKAEIEVRAFIEELVAETQSLAVQKHLAFRYTVDPAVTTMETDRDKLRQILLNLVSNAIKYTDNGSVEIAVEPYRPDAEPAPNVIRVGAEMEQDRIRHMSFICFSVRDTGIGIPEEVQPRIFDEFYQADGSTTRKAGGTGLGLSIVRKLSDLLGGRIELESTPGKGSVFTVIVPKTLVNPPSESRSLPPADRLLPGQTVTTQSVTTPPVPDVQASEEQPVVMAIDDDPDIINLIESSLEDTGYRVVGVTNSVQAIQEARRIMPRAITLDVLMPEANGWQVLQQLKSDPVLMTIPVIMLSIVSDRSAGYVLGADDYLVKPIDRERLLTTLNRLIRQRRKRPAIPAASTMSANGQNAPVAPVPAQSDGRTGSILAIDDEPDIRQIIADTLGEEGYNVQTASDGPTGLMLARTAQPDVIVLDLMMPDMDGFAVLEELRNDPRTATVPVVVLTAKSLSLAEREWLGLHATRIVQKGSLPLQQLASELRRFVTP